MRSMTYDIDHLKYTFLHNFTVTEHALKNNGFMHQNSNHAKADFRAFARALGDDFFKTVSEEGFATTLIQNPPARLMNNNCWEDMDGRRITNTQELFFMGVNRVRNSLIHGPKFLTRGSRESVRDRDLTVEANLTICRALSEAKTLRLLEKFDLSEISDL